MRKAITILFPILICFMIGLTDSHLKQDAIHTWYPTLNKSNLTPPNIVFPIAWSIIYLCIGTSIGIICISDSEKKKTLIKLFTIQLFFNFAWSFLFFYLQNPLWGFMDILALDIFVSAYIVKSYPEKKISSILF